MTVARSEQPTQNTTGSGGSTLDNLLNIEETTWIVVIQETLIYVLLFGRWLNDDVAGKNLSQQLINFLASASDIMELYALFDLPDVQTHFTSTIAVLAIWSMSFIQFIPVLTKTIHRQNAVADSSPPSIEAGENKKSAPSSRNFHIAEVVLTFLFQDGPFLAVRLFIIINFNTISHSLVFFVIKNVVTIMLLIYRLAVLLKAKPGKKQQ
ncbi:transmembrane protein 26-like [Dreissena polymorpha]|uniref:Transmembrane protein 26 n=2 Tax=Dreissena polymorpha TaxID=45954 RepID=A0A9D3YXH9_DREPO|nr:transmembrane protein 26-like [Dreissena polymorpha]KAH3708112.1 hypothetical protein DPMN_067551 [Dreissena polymorpha]